jgi:hypothetical protein
VKDSFTYPEMARRLQKMTPTVQFFASAKIL